MSIKLRIITLTQGMYRLDHAYMTLDFSSRLGLLGAVLALFSIAAFYMWPDKKWIGWLCLVFAGGLVLAWGVIEAKEKIQNPITSLVVSIAGGCIVGGLIGALIWNSAKTAPTPEKTEVVELSIMCDNIALPMAYRGDLWILDAVMFSGLGKLMAPSGKEALWPERDVSGLGYVCTVKNHGLSPAFGVTFQVNVNTLSLLREGSGWKSGEVNKKHQLTVSVPQPMGQQGSDQFSFYVCSYDPEGPLEIQLPLTAFINSDDPKNKREVPIKVASIAGNPFTVPPKLSLTQHANPASVKALSFSATENKKLLNQQHCETGSLCNQDTQVNAPQTVNNYGAPPIKITASPQIQRQIGNEWETYFTISSNASVQTGNLRLKCNGPVLRAGISRIDPMELVTGSNGPNPDDPNEVIYELKAETLMPGKIVTVAVSSVQPVTVISGSIGAQMITFTPQ